MRLLKSGMKLSLVKSVECEVVVAGEDGSVMVWQWCSSGLRGQERCTRSATNVDLAALVNQVAAMKPSKSESCYASLEVRRLFSWSHKAMRKRMSQKRNPP